MEPGGHVGTQASMYRPCDRGEARLERPTSVSYAEQVGGDRQETSLHETLLVCVFSSSCRQTTLW